LADGNYYRQLIRREKVRKLTHYKFCKHKNINRDKEQVLSISSDERCI
jgi:hypothetical protein